MINRIFGKGIPAMVFVFGMAVINNLNAQTECQLNGTWARLLPDGRELGGREYTFNNGVFEVAFLNALGRTTQTRGIYITSGESITMVVTHIDASYVFGEPGVFLTLEEAWLSFVDFRERLPPDYEFSFRFSPWAGQEVLNSIFTIRNRNFAISGNQLNISGADMTLTRR